MIKVLGVIPARYRSSRFPGKPLADIQGKPMVYHVYKAAAAASLLSEVVVATEDERIAQACQQLEVPAIMTASSHPTGTDRVAEVAAKVDAAIYVNIQGDEPMIDPATIDAAVRPLLDPANGHCLVTNLCAEITRPEEVLDTNTIKVVRSPDSWAIYLSRQPIPYPRDRQGLRYFKQVCVYAFRKAPLLQFGAWPQTPMERTEGIELLRLLEHQVAVKFFEVAAGSYAVDTSEDLRRVNELMASAKRKG